MGATNGSTAMVLANQAPASDNRLALEPRSFEDGMRLAETIVESNMFGVKSKAEAFIRLSTGVGLGLSAVQSLRGIYVINGKAGLSADLMMGLCRRSADCEFFRCIETTPTSATFEAKRKSDPKSTTISWSIKDADTAGLLGNAMYKKYPAQMLRARCIAALARLMFPEQMHGLYTADELKAGTVTNEDIPEAEFEQLVQEPAAEPVKVATEAKQDWDKLAAGVESALDGASSLDQVTEIKGQAESAFKTAPKPVRARVGEAFKKTRARLVPQDKTVEAVAE